MDDYDIRVAIATMGVATIVVGTMTQLATHGMFEKNQMIKASRVSTLAISKHKRAEEMLPIIHGVLECEQIFQEVFVNKASEQSIFGSKSGLYYIKPRSIHWWEQFFTVVMQEDLEHFRQFFRVSITTFQYICGLVNEELSKNPPSRLINIKGRMMTVPKQVAIALRRLGTGDTYNSVGELFGVHDSTSGKVYKRFISALIKAAMPLHLQWLRGEALSKIKLEFENLYGIPQCCGALDCSHVRFELPGKCRSTDWYDRDHNYSTIVQAIVDHEARFIDVFVGVPGSVHNSRILLMSNHFKEVIAERRLDGPTVHIQGVDIHELIVADSGYVGDKNLLVPWPRIQLPRLYEEFNFKHSSTRMVVERSFGILKRMWRILKTPITKPDLKRLPSMILGCCLLHNIVIDKNDVIDDSIVLWGHHDLGYRQQVVRGVPLNDSEQLQMAIARHVYELEATHFNE